MSTIQANGSGHAKAGMHDEELMLQMAMEASGSAAFEIHPESQTGRFVGNIRRLVGLSDDGPQLHPFEALATYVHPDDQADVLAAMLEASVPGGEFDVRYRVPHAQTGAMQWQRGVGRGVANETGGFRAIFGVIQDVTASVESEQDMAALHERFDAAVAAADIGTWSVDVATGIVQLDARMHEILGIQKGSFDGSVRAFFDHVDAADRAEVEAVFSGIVATGEPSDVRFRRTNEAGETAWLMARGRGVASANGTVTRVAGATWGIDIIVEAETAEERLRDRHVRSMGAAQVGCWSWEVASDTFEHDQRAADLMECTELPTMHAVVAAMLPEDQAHAMAVIGGLVTNPSDVGVLESRVRTANGSIRHLRAYGTVLTDAQGVTTTLLGVMMDITEQAKLRLALERSNAELDDFAHIASHDLREPLRGIHNYANFLTADYADKIDDEGRRMLSSLGRLAQRLEDLIGDLQSFSRLGRAELNVRSTPLDTVLDGVLETMEFSLNDAECAVIRPEPLPTVQCDGTRVGEVMRNLITNAIKYNDKAQRTVEVGYCNEHQAIYVRDNGIGIPSEHAERVFTMFKRLHTRDKFGGGTGAGLALTKRMVTRHGGNIWFDSEPGIGSTFYFTFEGLSVHE